MIIRQTSVADFDLIDAVHMSAFESTSFGHQGESQLVRLIHAAGDMLVSLVAQEFDQIVGHALFSAMIVEADGRPLMAAALAPVGVRPECHGRGIGTALINAGIAELRRINIQISFVLGNPLYYPRFGYSAVNAKPFASPYAGPHFMALFLDKSLLLPDSGTATYAAAFGAL